MIPLKDDSDMNQNLLEELKKEKEKNEELQKRLEDLTTQFSDNLELVGKFPCDDLS
ncbi:MAG: hypothetical protein IPG53_14075 [Ignavibacteriales bacterium]|nr:hypothetical protein [Ignavibacteriales bacterium]